MLPLPTRPSARASGARRLTAITASQRASSMLARSLSRVMPALLGCRPCRHDARPDARLCAPRRRRGDIEGQCRAPTRVAVSANASAAGSTSTATTAAPSRANTSAMVAPIPTGRAGDDPDFAGQWPVPVGRWGKRRRHPRRTLDRRRRPTCRKDESQGRLEPGRCRSGAR